MIHKEGFLTSVDGKTLFWQAWKTNQPKAIVLGIHGMGSHSGRLGYLAKALAEQGYTFYALDLRGHGRSQGMRAYLKHAEDYMRDVEAFDRFVRDQEPNRPVFILGHSMGGLIAFDTVMQQKADYRGIIVICPAIILHMLRRINRSIPQFVPYWFLKSERLNKNHLLTSDPHVLAELKHDTLRHGKQTVGMGRGLLKRLEWMTTHTEQMQTPILFLQGERDEVVSPEENRAFYDVLSLQDKTWISYPDMVHNPHEEKGREQVFEDVIGWVNVRAYV